MDHDSLPNHTPLLETDDDADVKPEFDAGSKLGPYEIVQEIGAGGMGLVYEGWQGPPMKRKVAIKVIKAGYDSKEVVARFQVERQALAMMNHPGIASVYASGTTPKGRPYFVMEFVDGDPLTDYCDDKKLSLRRRLMLFVDICEAVAHAHLRGVVHRDLKPANVLVSEIDGVAHVKLLDFGIAKAVSQKLSEQTLVTQAGGSIGTFDYMSPEQADAGSKPLHGTSDVYSLGVMLYELLVGRRPFVFDPDAPGGVLKIQQTISQVDPPRPSQTLASLDPASAIHVTAARDCDLDKLERELKQEPEWIIAKAMQKDPAHRYQSATDLAADVRSYLAGKPIKAVPQEWRYTLRKFVSRHRTSVGLAAIILGVFLGTVGSIGYLGWSALEENERLRERVTDLEMQVESLGGSIVRR
jgi:serine/threonine protein kinase